jgi:hypothetical protein
LNFCSSQKNNVQETKADQTGLTFFEQQLGLAKSAILAELQAAALRNKNPGDSKEAKAAAPSANNTLMSFNDIMAKEASKKRVRNFISNLSQPISASRGQANQTRQTSSQRPQQEESQNWKLNRINTINVFGLTTEDHQLLSRSLKFAIQFALPRKDELDQSFEQFARLIRFRFQYRENQTNFTKPMAKFYVRKPDKQPRKAIKIVEDYLAKTKLELQTRLNDALAKPLIKPNITKRQLDRLFEIKNDPKIVVKNADKNLGITLWNKADYIKEASKHLDNKDAYIQVRSAPETKIIENVKQMLSCYDGLIDSDMLNWVNHQLKKPVKLPKFYLLPKLHKNPVSSRPITAAHSWITTGLAVAVDHLLRPIVEPIKEILKDTNTLVQDLEKTIVQTIVETKVDTNVQTNVETIVLDLEHQDVQVWLITADVQSLYTVIPIEEGLEATREAMREAKLSTSTQSFVDWAQRLILNNNYFEFEGKVFKQSKGAAMGANDAPVFANLFVLKQERPVIRKHQARILLYRRLLDDVLTIIKGTRNEAESFIHDLQAMHPSLKLTVTIDDSKASFLDITIFKGKRFRTEGKLDSKPFEKQMNPYLYIPFSSAHSRNLKLGWIKAEIQRLIRNSSDESDFNEAKSRLQVRLRLRGYPQKFLKEALQQTSFNERKTLLENKKELIEGPQKVFFKTRFNRLYEQVKIGQVLFKNFNDELRDLLGCIPCVCFTKAQTFAHILAN